MAVWWWLASTLISLVISDLTRPKPDDAPRPGLDDLRRNKSSQAKRLPVVWGMPINSVANLAWYGGMTTQEITKESKGMFSSDEVTVGYTYSLVMQLILSVGGGASGCRIYRAWANDKLVFPDSAVATFNPTMIQQATMDADFRAGTPKDPSKKKSTIYLTSPMLFGGEEKGGGIVGYLTFYTGQVGQGVNPRLLELIGATSNPPIAAKDFPEFNKVAYCVYDGTIGTTGEITQWTFQQQRIPSLLPTGGGYDPALHSNIMGEANAAEMLYEILVDKDWGMGLNSEMFIDIPSFQAAGRRLAEDVMGLSMLWDEGKSLSSVMKEILRHIDGILFVNSLTGRFQLRLVRPTTDFSTVLTLNNSNCELASFTRPNVDELVNELKIIWSDTKNKKDKVHVVQDASNYMAQDKQIVSSEVRYPGFTKLSTVKRVALRDLRRMSYPLAKASLDNVARVAYTLTPGSKIILDFPEHGIDKLLMVVTELDYGDFKSRKIQIECLQDVSLMPDYEGEKDDSSLWDPSGYVAEDVEDFKLTSRPYFFNDLDVKVKDKQRTWFHPMFLAVDPVGYSLGFKLAKKVSAELSKPPANSALVLEKDIKPFTPAGYLLQDLQRSSGVDTNGLIIRLVTVPANGVSGALETPDDDTDVQINGMNMVMIGDEIIALRTIEYLSAERSSEMLGGKFIRATEIWRGMLDSPQAPVHAAGSPVWFFPIKHASVAATVVMPNSTAGMYLKFLTVTAEETLEKGNADVHYLKNIKRAAAPYPVKNTYLSGKIDLTEANPSLSMVVSWRWDNKTATVDDEGVTTDDEVPYARKWSATSIAPEGGSTKAKVKIQLFDSFGTVKYETTLTYPAITHIIPAIEIADADESAGYLEVRLTTYNGEVGNKFPESIYFRKSYPLPVASSLDNFFNESINHYWALEE